MKSLPPTGRDCPNKATVAVLEASPGPNTKVDLDGMSHQVTECVSAHMVLLLASLRQAHIYKLSKSMTAAVLDQAALPGHKTHTLWSMTENVQ